jgi:hypothetical protein
MMLGGSNKLRMEREEQRKNRKEKKKHRNKKRQHWKNPKNKIGRKQRKGQQRALRARTFEDKMLT